MFGFRTMSLFGAGGEMVCTPEHGLVPESSSCPGGNSLRSRGIEDWKQTKSRYERGALPWLLGLLFGCK